ncbi:hypothetical protein BV25DRAFT_1921526 [Artomyces pyxidatus]|uniref:Uncharacterized protein n=1 Tax=Artomyces pyxidatus TaxID=48021 RepID=A0ACB8SHP3_9AGAM|nr:hypothetical protein BV25DRAFT_1921526 [Artomyces pyxidatus]
MASSKRRRGGQRLSSKKRRARARALLGASLLEAEATLLEATRSNHATKRGSRRRHRGGRRQRRKHFRSQEGDGHDSLATSIEEMVIDPPSDSSAPIMRAPVKIRRPGRSEPAGDSRAHLEATLHSTEIASVPSTYMLPPASSNQSPVKIRRHGRGEGPGSGTRHADGASLGTITPLMYVQSPTVKIEADDAPFDGEVENTAIDCNALAAASAEASLTISDEEFNAWELQYPLGEEPDTVNPVSDAQQIQLRETVPDAQPIKLGGANVKTWRQDMLHRLSIVEEGLSEILGICQLMTEMFGVED